jgi:PAS domain S-box-containing protein
MDPLLQKIEEAAKNAKNSTSVEEGMGHLAKAFSLFSQEASNLKQNYYNLQEKFKAVGSELETTNEQLQDKVAELKTLTSYLNNILKNMSQGLLFIDKEGTITTCNEAALKILNLDEKKVLYNNFWNCFSDEYFGFSLRNALTFGLSQKMSYLCLNDAHKEKKEIEVTGTYVAEEGSYQGIILMLRDVTQMQKLQMIASRNDRLKELGEMAAVVAHEIRNPLGGIRGFASLLYRDLEQTPHLKEMAQYILEGTKSLERLVMNVLQFAKPVQIQPALHDIVSLIKEVIRFIKVDPNFSNHVKIEMHFTHEKFEAFVDKELLKSALLNLFMNALQSMEDQKVGLITLSLLQANDSYKITLSDTGKGIEEKDLDKIFSPFFTTKEKGTGLGLSETYKIIQAHFGTIDVRSEHKVGTTFTITLPLKK